MMNKVGAVFVWSCVCLWMGFRFGANESDYQHRLAMQDFKRYACSQGVVYRRNPAGYWEDTKQGCKTEEQIK